MIEQHNNIMEKEPDLKNSSARCFLSDTERTQILDGLRENSMPLSRFYAALQKRVYNRVANKGLLGPDATVAWYYPAAEYLSDAAMLYALAPDERLANWLRTVTLDIARTSAYDWAGPAFRDHAEPLTGHLETAHLCWALASVYDLAKDAFPEPEQAKIRQALWEKGIPLCQRWLAKNNHIANWRGILASGIVVAAAALGDETLLDEYVPVLAQCVAAFQPDGSYGESLQYGNYLAFALMLGYESLIRQYPEKAAWLDVRAYSRGIRWVANSIFYQKPLLGWGTEPRARAANFNDSAALFRPSGDLLLHMAIRSGCSQSGCSRSDSDEEKGLARHLFSTYYEPVPAQGPHELATFGMNNDWGFLTLPLLTHESQPVSPQEAGLPLTTSFSNGHAFMRDAWDGRTIVAINGGGDGLYGPGHLHGDLNSFILVHNHERLLVDPGHSCYRNLIHGLESSTQTHNTCTFLAAGVPVEKESLGLQEDKAKATVLEQKSVLPRRLLINGKPGEPVDRGNRRLLAERDEPVSVVGAEISQACGVPIHQFSRFWLMAGSNVLFVVDRIEATQPVTTVWNWLVNNRDGQAQVIPRPTCLTVRRNEAGMKLFHGGNGHMGHPVYGYVHDAYHVEPNQYGEGKPGSGLLYRWTEAAPAATRTVVHAIALDDAVLLDHWALVADNNTFTLANGQKKWTLRIQDEATNHLSLVSGHGRRWDVRNEAGQYSLKRMPDNL